MKERFMELALSLAKRWKGITLPNPTVGAVLVKGGRIIGVGFHEGPYKKHAEVVAIEGATESPKGAELFVTLEPCTHYGRTPPCTQKILEAGIKKVYVGVRDENLKVSGVEKLREEGVEVEEGILKEECYLLNEDFFTYVRQRRPFITLKFAQSLDGKLATFKKSSKWITSSESRRIARIFRGQANAILVGVNTVLRDNPSLNAREMPTKRKILKVILDYELQTPPDAKIFEGEDEVLIFTQSRRKRAYPKNCQIVRMEKLNLREVLKELHRREVVHLFVEGGATTITSFLREGLFDRLIVFTSFKIFGEGLSLGDLGVGEVKDSLKL